MGQVGQVVEEGDVETVHTFGMQSGKLVDDPLRRADKPDISPDSDRIDRVYIVALRPRLRVANQPFVEILRVSNVMQPADIPLLDGGNNRVIVFLSFLIRVATDDDWIEDDPDCASVFSRSCLDGGGMGTERRPRCLEAAPPGLVTKTMSDCRAAKSMPAGEPVALIRRGRPKSGFGVIKPSLIRHGDLPEKVTGSSERHNAFSASTNSSANL